jgi:hypothetical protein
LNLNNDAIAADIYIAAAVPNRDRLEVSTRISVHLLEA